MNILAINKISSKLKKKRSKMPNTPYSNRCVSYRKKSQPQKQHIWFLPTQKQTLKNQKSCFLPTLE